MRILLQLSLLFALTLIGEAISAVLPFTFPGTLIAMFLLLLLLGMGVIKEHQLEGTADFLLRYMAMFFVPPSVEIIENLELLRSSWLPLVFISAVSLVTTFFITAKAVEITDRIMKRRNAE